MVFENGFRYQLFRVNLQMSRLTSFVFPNVKSSARPKTLKLERAVKKFGIPDVERNCVKRVPVLQSW